MRASITVSRISISLLMAAAFSLCPAPSAAAPTMQWDGDQTVTGNHVTLGKAGIGTASTPASPLLVYQYDGQTGNAAGVTIQQNGTGDAVLHFIQSLTSGYWALGIDKVDSNKFKIGTGWDIRSAPKVTIDTSGNVGIGIPTPVAKLDVVGNIKGSGTLTLTQMSTAGYVKNSVAGLLSGETKSTSPRRM